MSDPALRVVIVDDEAPARRLLRRFLADYPDVVVVGEAADGASAVTLIRETNPDAVFLDIRLPEGDGFTVVDALGQGLPLIVFVTAYDRYAIRAFEANALDYILKPLDPRRLRLAVERLRARRDVGAPDLRAVAAAIVAMRSRPSYLQRIAVRVERDRILLVPTAAVDWLEADGKFVRLHVGRAVYRARDQIGRLEGLLDPERFARVSRAAIVQVDRIREVQPWFAGDYVLLLTTEARVETTRAYRAVVRALLGRDGSHSDGDNPIPDEEAR
jgi:two-component system LytT family response regulator